LHPLHIRFTGFIFALVMDLALNCAFYSDNYISQRHTAVGVKKDFIYTITNEYAKSIWAAIISGFIASVVEILVKPKKSAKEEMNEALKSRNEEEIKLADIEFRKAMRCRYIFYYLSVYIINVFFLYLVTTFCYVYTKSQIGWLQGSVISMVLRIFVLEVGIPLILCSFRYFSLRWNQKWIYYIGFVIYIVNLLT